MDVPTCIKDVESIRSSLRGCAFFRDAIEELRSVLLTIYRFLLEASISVDSCVRNRVYSSAVSQYQYAFVLEVHSQLRISKPIEVFDPVMDSVDVCFS